MREVVVVALLAMAALGTVLFPGPIGQPARSVDVWESFHDIGMTARDHQYDETPNLVAAAMADTGESSAYERRVTDTPRASLASSAELLAPGSIAEVATPYGPAAQGTSRAAMAARAEVESGTTLWRLGTSGQSAAAEAQFWSLEHPLTPGFASRYGIPAENVLNADFIESAVLRPGSPFVTRVAPGIGSNLGGGIEVVVPEGGAWLRGFSIFGPKGAM